MIKVLAIVIFAALALLFCACSSGSGARYVKNSSDYVSLGIDRHDLESVVEKSTKSLLESPFVKNLKNVKTLAISDLSNLTNDDIDVEFFSRKIARSIGKSRKFTLTNAIAGSGASVDSLIRDSRKLTDDDLYNQRTTQEKGTLIAPDYSLSGKIIQRTKNIGDNVRIDYDFLIILTDLKTGRVVWDDERHISKIVKKAEVGQFTKLGEGTCDGGDSLDCDRLANEAFDADDYKKSYKLFKKACKLGSSVSCENAEYAKNTYKAYKKENRDWHFGFLIGGDIGIGSANVNMVPIPYTSTPSSSSGSGSGTIRLNSDPEFGDWFAYPYMLKAGIFLQQKLGFYLNANILYGGYNYTATDSEYDFKCTGNSSGYCSWEKIDLEGLAFNHTLLGWNLRIGLGGYDNDGNGAFFIGGGSLMDYGSKMKGTGGFVIDKTLQNTYPFWEIGFFFSSNHIFFIETSYRYMFDGDSNKDFASVASLNMGIGILLPLW